MHDVCFCVWALVWVCACVWLYVWLTVCACVCQSEGMDACQRREQHHVRVLADDAHFRCTNSNSQLGHETISSHDSPHSLPVCFMWFSTAYSHTSVQVSANVWLSLSFRRQTGSISTVDSHTVTDTGNYIQIVIKETHLFYFFLNIVLQRMF